jgi:hypothetical protein
MCGAKRHIPQRHRRIDLCSHSEGTDLLARGNMRIHIVDDLAHARKQPAIIQHRLAHRDAVSTQLSSFLASGGFEKPTLRCRGQLS